MNPESYSSKMKQNNSTELLRHCFLNIYSKDGPSDPPRPQLRIFSWISQIFYRKSFFFGFSDRQRLRSVYGFPFPLVGFRPRVSVYVYIGVVYAVGECLPCVHVRFFMCHLPCGVIN